jgi:hypothetical protein
MEKFLMSDPAEVLVARMCQASTEQTKLADEFLNQANSALEKAHFHALRAIVYLDRAKAIQHE